ncbi:unnamed protein product [Bemisia tabaci]|uniref:RING-type E3 ubiquitin transferase n=1 Tax=Bemisia tabaci TaxID=7038 RepID=A0A9P0EWG0_BEMTA|nr:unnamed protein product [Bemisia tabaci]
MWCLVSQPNAIIIEVEVDSKAKGQECLEKVCSCLGITNESDYFGLKYRTVKGHDVWINLRNPIERQVVGVAPHRFGLRVKFWVPPHLLLQETTRHQFYLHAKSDLMEGKLKVGQEIEPLKLIALLSQSELGDYESCIAPMQMYNSWCHQLNIEASEEELETIAALHKEMKGMKQSTAEYWIVKEVSNLPSFGEELFLGKTDRKSESVSVGVGPHGLTVYQGTRKQLIPFTAIRSAASQKRAFTLWYFDQFATETTLELKLSSSLSANELYRALTEKHAFYSCETVRGAVTSQFIRDLKGTIVSIFNEHSPLGKKYVFDIQRTCREVHDNARRALYDASQQSAAPSKIETQSGIEQKNSDADKLARLMDALTCRICMDSSITTVFFPCAHVVACGNCASRCEVCPLCRSPIKESKRVYLPTLSDVIEPRMISNNSSLSSMSSFTDSYNSSLDELELLGA